MATHCSILAWRIPWTEEPGRLQSMGGKELDTTEYACRKRVISACSFCSYLLVWIGSVSKPPLIININCTMN